MFKDFAKRRCSSAVAKRSVQVCAVRVLPFVARLLAAWRLCCVCALCSDAAQVCFPQRYSKCVAKVFDSCYDSKSPYEDADAAAAKAAAGPADAQPVAVPMPAPPTAQAASPCSALARRLTTQYQHVDHTPRRANVPVALASTGALYWRGDSSTGSFVRRQHST